MSLIPETVIQQIINKADIVDIIGEYVSLQKRGNNYYGLCPFHDEKTPSFSVSPQKNIYKCFGCGEGGNAISFIQKIKGLSYIETIQFLANQMQIDVDQYLKGSNYFNLRPFYEVLKFASNFYHYYLVNTTDGEEAVTYLSNRGLSKDILIKFNIGLAPDYHDGLYKTLKENDYTDLTINEAGLIISSKNGSTVDRFRNRIIFPIKDFDGNFIGFSGRVFGNNEDTAKYINSPETKVFHKSDVLYNFSEAKKDIVSSKTVYLFEGFMDVIAAYRSGIYNAVATMGTAFTENHANFLKKYCENVVICFDGDNAGKRATQSTIKILKKYQLNIDVITFENNLDPDDYLNRFGPEKLKGFLENQKTDLYEYYYIIKKEKYNLTRIIDRDNFKNDIFNMLRRIPNEYIIQQYLKKLSDDIETNLEFLMTDFFGIKKKIISNNIKSTVKNNETLTVAKNRYQEAVYILIAYFISDYRFLGRIIDKIEKLFDIKIQKLIFKLITIYNKFDTIDYNTIEENILLNSDEKVIINASFKYYQKIIENITKDEFPKEYLDCIKVREIKFLEDQKDLLSTNYNEMKIDDNSYSHRLLEINIQLNQLKNKKSD